MSSTVIGIGASAGGLEAITELLAALPPRPGAAVVVVQHLERTHDSLLSGLLRRRTKMPVLLAEHGMEPKRDHVYVIPPDATLTISGGLIALAPRAEGREVHKPVDALFRSLAQEFGDAAVGVVLSGGDGDGSDGIQAIKQAGGITFAQAPETAGVASMPLSAIDTGCVDFVMAPREIARELVRLAAHPYLRVVPAPGTDEPNADDPDALRRVFRRVRASHGVDFARYKSSTLRRRLARRMAVQKVDTIAEYADFMETDEAETAALYQDFLIRVTSFFRDPESFRVLAEQIFPQLAAARSQKDPIRIWVPGCATGEEVYSIAIALIESMGQAAPAAGIQIFGTDVSETAIEKSRAGVYSDAIALDVSPERLRRFFVRKDSHYTIARSIRDLCVFARHDITRDPPYSRLDLISCRNLLIYLGTAAQDRIMQVFRYALRSHGCLILGPSETVGHGEEFFEAIDKQQRIYRPKAAHGDSVSGIVMEGERKDGKAPSAASSRQVDRDYIESDAVQRQADRLLIARYAPAGILVDESFNILQFRGHTAPYLAPASGPPSLNFMRIARPELLLAVPPLLRETQQSGRTARRTGIVLDGLDPVDVELVPIPESGGVGCFLILIEDPQSAQRSQRERRTSPVALPEAEKDQRLSHLERENFELREFLQATMEQHEAAKEELKAAHEEVLSANEEFQSTNEELETSKEELQSSNEELTTTNDELRERNLQLGVLNAEINKARVDSDHARAYADGIVETVRDPLVVLDGSLKVLRVNKAFCGEFSVTAERVEGQSLDIVSSALWAAPLNEKLSAILSQGPVLDDFEVIYHHPQRGLRLLCLNGRKIIGDADRGELILLAIEDITDARRRNDDLRDGSRRKDEFLAMLAHELRNPLGAITHAMHLLKHGNPDYVADMHAMIERQSGRLVRLVNDLLDVSRVSRGLIELQRKPVDLTQILRDAAAAARGRLDERRHVLTLSLPSSPVGVDGDPVRLEQVVANLLENAIKYTQPGGKIAMSLAERGSSAVVRIADNGIGISPENVHKVFDLFTQLDPSHPISGGGLGLGLTVVQRVLELHGGRIEVHSAGAGKGSEFIATLPMVSIPVETPQVEVRHDRVVAGTPRRVLIVDDSEDSTEVMSLVFQQWGHDVKTAGSGVEALRLMESFLPHVAFVDIGLPDIDGYEVARRIRSKPGSPVQLVALTGYGTTADRQRAFDAGFNEHIVKPADADRLAELLGND